MTTPLRLGIAGLGTVGRGVVRIVQTHAEKLSQRAGRPVVITAVSAQSKSKTFVIVKIYHFTQIEIEIFCRIITF